MCLGVNVRKSRSQWREGGRSKANVCRYVFCHGKCAYVRTFMHCIGVNCLFVDGSHVPLSEWR